MRGVQSLHVAAGSVVGSSEEVNCQWVLREGGGHGVTLSSLAGEEENVAMRGEAAEEAAGVRGREEEGLDAADEGAAGHGTVREGNRGCARVLKVVFEDRVGGEGG